MGSVRLLTVGASKRDVVFARWVNAARLWTFFAHLFDEVHRGEVCRREVSIAFKQTSLVEAAQLMRQNHVGCLVVVDDEDGSRSVRGLITDRDMVMSVIATGLDPAPLCVEDVMTERLVTALESDSLMDLMRSMREHGVRRVPVVGLQDELIGLVTMDDVLKILAQELTLLVGSVDTGLKREKKRRQ
jgi:CBS domain-containing protein